MISSGFFGLREKLKQTSLVELLLSGLPKLEQSKNDLHSNINSNLRNMFDQSIKDFTFIISKHLCEFIQRYEFITDYIEQGAKESKKDVEKNGHKELKSHISKESIKKVYLSFLHNIQICLKEMCDKIAAYVDKKIVDVLNKNFFVYLLDNIEVLLHQFYIIVSKHYDGEEYESFKFEGVSSIISLFNTFLEPLNIKF